MPDVILIGEENYIPRTTGESELEVVCGPQPWGRINPDPGIVKTMHDVQCRVCRMVIGDDQLIVNAELTHDRVDLLGDIIRSILDCHANRNHSALLCNSYAKAQQISTG
jgi:hypothetical protein